jgi:xylulokinase
MDLLATGTGYRWLSELFAWDDGHIDQCAAQSVPGAHGLCFPPYLAGGEQGALWNPRLRGAILGLGLRHSRADIARSFLEGVFFEIKRCVDVLAETAPIDCVMISGKIVHSPSSTQLLARRIAGIELGLDRHTRSAPLSKPDESAARVYAGLYQHYLAQSELCG